MDRLYRTLAQFSKFRPRQDDDLCDRIHYAYTTIILVMFSIIVSTKQYVGEPISCWTPAHYTSGHLKYANNICWIINTYWLPINRAIPKVIMSRKEKEIHYYQWVPFLLLMQAILFYVPCFLWRSFNGRSGINVKSIVEVSVDIHSLNPDSRAKTIRYVSRHLELCLDNQREYRSGCSVRLRQWMARTCCFICGRRYGNYLVVLYLSIKMLYLLHVGGELYFIKVVLGTNYTMYGWEVINDLRAGRDWQDSGKFPRVTLCDFEVRQVGNVHRHTVQCVLPINMFNEKMFLFLWFWFFFIGCITALNGLMWLTEVMFPETRTRYIKKHLRIAENLKKSDSKLVDRFVNQYLRQDGVFVLRLVARNAGDLVVSEIINTMWKNFSNRPVFKDVDTVLNSPGAAENAQLL